MTATVYCTRDDGEQEVAGHFELVGDRIVAHPRPGANNARLLAGMLKEPIDVVENDALVEVTAVGDPERWIKGLSRFYSGSALRVSTPTRGRRPTRAGASRPQKRDPNEEGTKVNRADVAEIERQLRQIRMELFGHDKKEFTPEELDRLIAKGKELLRAFKQAKDQLKKGGTRGTTR
jgi:hypothetical protein